MCKTIPEIIERAGGRHLIAERTGLTPDAGRKWPIVGIPDRHWPILMDMVPGLTAERLFRANIIARGKKPAKAVAAE